MSHGPDFSILVIPVSRIKKWPYAAPVQMYAPQVVTGLVWSDVVWCGLVALNLNLNHCLCSDCSLSSLVVLIVIVVIVDAKIKNVTH